MNKLLTGVILVGTGLVGGYLSQPFVQEQLQSAGILSSSEEDSSTASSGEKKILYWVAPMDANYRRDKPGKSPMGMDLVPVYEDEGGEEGVVKISPVVQNNLGVRVSTVKKGQLDRKINTVGYIQFDEEKLYHLHTRVEGWVEQLDVKATGDVVRKGQKLFELYSPALVNAQEEYITALKSGNRILINASKDRLLSLGLTLDQINNLAKTRKIEQRIAYYSKHDGFIQNLMIREGMFVKPSMDVLTIGQIDTVWVIAEVFERQIGWIKKGQTVDMTVAAYPGQSWKGIVDYIYPVLDKKTRTLRVRIRFNNPEKLLKPNMFSQLIIHSSLNKETLYVKREAIIRNGNMERVVKALGDGKFLSVAVKTGTESGGYVEIIKGLKENEKIVTSAQFLIDSESSLTAAFDRMEEPEDIQQGNSEQTANLNQVWIKGEIVDVMAGHNMLTIQHKAVAEWGWPDMLMDFPVKKSLGLNSLKVKQAIKFLVEKHDDGSIEIIEITQEDGNTKAETMPENQVWITGTILNVMPEHNMLSIQHPEVPKWGWPSMEMDFQVVESLDISPLKTKEKINFLVNKLDSGAVQIIEINKEGLK